MNYGDFAHDGADRDVDDRYGDAADEPIRAASGRASVGSGGPFGTGVGAGPVKGSASAGRASVGRASVGRATVSDGYDDHPTGRASVPSAGAGVVGRATVGRASVRAASPV